ncbi:MAG TPA: ABC transporter permease [Vicinamibacterales bacterium]|nr:ABC transporter permease [Vicinamibacterales bacterium]
MMRAFRIVQRNALVFRRVWRGSIFMTFLQPTLYLAAMGLGLGSLVDRGGTPLPGGVSYLTFLAPGLLAASCMQAASFESSFPITSKMLWQRNYEAIHSAPMGVADIVMGELLWVGVRLLAVAVVFSGVIWLFGAARGLFVLAAIPAAVLTGLAFSAPIIAFAAALKRGGSFNELFRFVITPLFLFSGVFFPIARLPRPLQALAGLTPLYHGVELTRGLALHTLTWSAAAVHAGYLTGLVLLGAVAAVWTFSRKLRA